METLHLPVNARRKTRRRQRWVQDPIRSRAAVLYPVPYNLTISRSDSMVHINAYPNLVLFVALHATVSPIEQGFRPAFFVFTPLFVFRSRYNYPPPPPPQGFFYMTRGKYHVYHWVHFRELLLIVIAILGCKMLRICIEKHYLEDIGDHDLKG